MLARIAACGIAVALLGWGGATLSRFEARPLTLSGVRLPDGDPEPMIRELATDWYETQVTLDVGSHYVRATRRELGGVLDVRRTVEDVRARRGNAPIWSRGVAFAQDAGTELVWHRSVREHRARAFVDALRRRTDIAASAHGRDGRGGSSGLLLQPILATETIANALRSDAVVVRLPVRLVEPPARPVFDMSTASYSELVAAYETRYNSQGELYGRANNIELAARALDSVTIPPGGELSFNDVVGERSYERGFQPAIELANGGRRTEGIGGGVCQTAATLHAAAFFGAFEILEHHPHTRESSYIEPGLDAAVSWPGKDMRIRNPHRFPVRIRATAYRGLLRIELRGAERAPRVRWDTEVMSRIPRGVERQVDRNLPLGSSEVLDEGEDGSIVERTRTIDWPDGPVTETVTLNYPVVHRLIRAGPTAVGQ